MKNVLKKIAFNFTEKAFTCMGIYAPKMPKTVKKIVDSKK